MLDALSGDANQEVVREAVSELALRRLWMSNKRRRRKRLMIDVDGLPVQVHGQQPGSEYHGYYHQHRVVADARYVVDALRLQPLERFTVGKASVDAHQHRFTHPLPAALDHGLDERQCPVGRPRRAGA